MQISSVDEETEKEAEPDVVIKIETPPVEKIEQPAKTKPIAIKKTVVKQSAKKEKPVKA